MNAQTQGNSSAILKVVVALLGIGILGLGYYTYDMYNEYNATKQDLELQKEELINDLENTKLELNQAIQDKTEVSDQLSEAKTRIESLIDEIKNTKKLNARVIAKYKREIATLKAQRDELYQIADSLRNANMQLIVEKDSLSSDLERQKLYADTLYNKNQALSQSLDKAKILYPTKIKAEGVKIRKSGKIIETTRHKRAQQIRVCFTLPKNELIEYGPQKFYVKVTNPNGEVIGDNDVINSADNQIIVSSSEKIIYENKPIDVCLFVKPQNPDQEMVKGDYAIEIYHNTYKVGSTNLVLK